MSLVQSSISRNHFGGVLIAALATFIFINTLGNNPHIFVTLRQFADNSDCSGPVIHWERTRQGLIGIANSIYTAVHLMHIRRAKANALSKLRVTRFCLVVIAVGSVCMHCNV